MVHGKANPSPSLPLSGEGDSSAPPLTRGGREGLGFIPYDKKLTALARDNRRNPTAAESRMWNEVLRMRRFAAYKFLRQKPIGNYIADCARLRLAIEIDGDSHGETAEYDAARTSAMQASGITVVRHANDEVMHKLPGVYEDLMHKIMLLEATVGGR